MTEILPQLQYLLNALKANIGLSLLILGVFWGIHFINLLLGYRLNRLGIYPRHLLGLPGIITSPFLHGDFNHLFFNSIPLLVLINLLLLYGLANFISVTLMIVILSGGAIWLLGRKGFHVGASSLIMGYWGYLLVNAYENPSVVTAVLAVVCLYYFGGLIINLFHAEEGASWEGHVFGFLAGVATNFLLK
jgi:membrane associated rhomboid family serine protease